MENNRESLQVHHNVKYPNVATTDAVNIFDQQPELLAAPHGNFKFRPAFVEPYISEYR